MAPPYAEASVKKGRLASLPAKISRALITTPAKGSGISLTAPKREVRGPNAGVLLSEEACVGFLRCGVSFSAALAPTVSITHAYGRAVVRSLPLGGR